MIAIDSNLMITLIKIMIMMMMSDDGEHDQAYNN